MNQSYAALTTQVKNQVEVKQAVIDLVRGIGAKITDAGTDSALLKQLTESLQESAEAFADAVLANTPSAGPGGVENPDYVPPVEVPLPDCTPRQDKNFEGRDYRDHGKRHNHSQ